MATNIHWIEEGRGGSIPQRKNAKPATHHAVSHPRMFILGTNRNPTIPASTTSRTMTFMTHPFAMRDNPRGF